MTLETRAKGNKKTQNKIGSHRPVLSSNKSVPFVGEDPKPVSSLKSAIILQNPPPSFIARPHDTATHALLSSLESLLLPSALPRLSLAGLGLSTRELSNLQVLSRAQRVLEWYLSFSRNLATGSTAIPSRTKARAILFGVRSLDLSKNQLDGESQWRRSGENITNLVN